MIYPECVGIFPLNGFELPFQWYLIYLQIISDKTVTIFQIFAIQNPEIQRAVYCLGYFNLTNNNF